MKTNYLLLALFVLTFTTTLQAQSYLPTKQSFSFGGSMAKSLSECKGDYMDLAGKPLCYNLNAEYRYYLVPSFAIGATFGCLAGQIMGFSPSLSAAAGMTAVFCGVTNCPVTSILIAFELFGFQGVSYYLLAMQCPDITGCIKTRRSCTQNIRRNM